MKHLNLSILYCLMFLSVCVCAQDKKTDFDIRAGISVGAASPVGFPVSIRKINKFNPDLLISVQTGATYHISKQWGIASALRFEQKGMTTEAQVKGYYTSFNAGNQSGSESISGYYTGKVETIARNSYLTLPLHVIYSFNAPISLRAGGFVSALLEKSFSGSARDGYLRDQTPVGEKKQIDDAAFDFSNQVRFFNAGAEIGADYSFSSHMQVSLLFNWALTPLMKKDFQSIDFNLYNIFANLGVVYKF